MEYILPKPTSESLVCGGIATVRAWGVYYHPKYKKYNWSLRKLQEQKYELARELLLRYAKNTNIWAPVPTKHNGEVVDPRHIWFPEIDKETEGIIIRRGIHADGVVLHSSLETFLFTPADCATLVVSYTDMYNQAKVIVGHASRNSLINMTRFNATTSSREHEGLVESILKHIPLLEIKNSKAWIGIGIRPGPHFAHDITSKDSPWDTFFINYVREKYGENCFADDSMGKTKGWLDLQALIKAQLMYHGFFENSIELDSVCTYADTDNQGDPVWYSNVRNNLTQEGEREAYRNLILVVRNY